MLHIEILRTADGALRAYDEPGEWNLVRDFQWGDGNYACDCNRGLFFARAGGDEREDVSCGMKAYLVRITDDAGTVVYEDEDWPETTQKARR